MFNKSKNIFSIIKSGTVDDLTAHLEKYPDSVHLKKSIRSKKLDVPLPNAPIFIHAVLHQRLDMLPILKAAGADINGQDIDRWSALQLAIREHQQCDIDNTEIIRTLLDMGISTKMSLNEEALEYTHLVEIKKLIDPDYIEPVDESTTRDTFVYENDHMVSYTENGEATGITIKTIFNFAQKNIITQIKDKDGQCAIKESFKNASNPQELQNAATFLSEQNGDLCGFKLNIVN